MYKTNSAAETGTLVGFLVALFVFACFSFSSGLRDPCGFHCCFVCFRLFFLSSGLRNPFGLLNRWFDFSCSPLFLSLSLGPCLPLQKHKKASPESKASNRKEVRRGENRGKKRSR